MTSDSPYQPPAAHPPSLTPPLPAGYSPKPTVVTVFGVLHLVLAAFGVFGFVMLMVQPALMAFLGKDNPALKKQMEMQASYQWWMNLSGVISLLLAIVLIVAGIKLLKRRANALGWSNIYSFASVVVKILSLAVSLTFVAPVMRAHAQDLPTPAFFLSTTWYLICGLIAMIYPVLTWILLNRPQVKRWFEESGR